MKKAEALRKIRELAMAEVPMFSLDGVDTGEPSDPYPIYTNYKTAEFVRKMEMFANRHPENDMFGMDYVDLLIKTVVSDPDVFYFSPAGTEYITDAWVLKKYVELPGMVGLAYTKWFDIDTVEPIVDAHLD